MRHDKISFTREYCLCRRIPYRIVGEALYLDHYFECYSLLNLSYPEIVAMIDHACEYDNTLYTYIGRRAHNR